MSRGKRVLSADGEYKVYFLFADRGRIMALIVKKFGGSSVATPEKIMSKINTAAIPNIIMCVTSL